MRRFILLLLCIALAQAGNSKLDNLLENLDITPEMIDKLTSGNKTVVTATVSELLRKQLSKKNISLEISPEEARFSQNLPNQCQDTTSCGCRAETRDVQVYAAIKRSSSFTTSNNLFKDDGIFLEAMIDAEIGAFGDIRAKGTISDLREIGKWANKEIKNMRKKRSPGFRKSFKKVWKKVVRNPIKKINRELIQRPLKKLKCIKLVKQKTIGFNLVSNGVVKIGISLRLGNLSLTEADGGMLLSFQPTFDIIGQVVSWNLDQIKASKCVERIAGLKLISYCGYLEKKAREKIEKNMKRIQNVKLPAVIAKLEKKIETKIGKTVSILIPAIEFLSEDNLASNFSSIKEVPVEGDLASNTSSIEKRELPGKGNLTSNTYSIKIKEVPGKGNLASNTSSIEIKELPSKGNLASNTSSIEVKELSSDGNLASIEIKELPANDEVL